MQADLEKLRFAYETKLYQALEGYMGEIPERDEAETQNLLQARRRDLLGDAVCITADLLPEVHQVYQSCLDVLGGGFSGNLFVRQCNEYNASVLAHEKNFDVVINSALLKDFDLQQLSFVFGHELGHVVFGHSRFSVHEILSHPDGVPADLASLLFRWSRAAEVSADRMGLLCCSILRNAVSALFLTASGLTGIDEDRVMRSLRSQYDLLERHIHEVGGSHGWIRTHPMIPIRFKALELAALDLTALRQGASGFSWAGFRGIDAKISALLEAMDEQVDISPAAVRGPLSKDGQLCLFLALVYVALAHEQDVSWNMRSFVTDLFMGFRSQLPVGRMLDNVQQDPAGFRAEALEEALPLREALKPQDVVKILELATLLVVKAGPVRASHYKALDEVCQAYGGDQAAVRPLVMRVQMSGSSVEQVLEDW